VWVVLQGVGVANAVWNSALDYLDDGGAIVEASDPSESLTPELLTRGHDVYKSVLCMALLESELKKIRTHATDKLPSVPNFASSVVTSMTLDSSSIEFPGDLSNVAGGKYSGYQGFCGSASFFGEKENIRIAHLLGTIYMMQSMMSDARQQIKDYQYSLDHANLTQPYRTIIHTDPDEARDEISNALLLGALTYISALPKGEGGGTGHNFIPKAKTDGWILAGKYYYNLVDVKAGAAKKDKPPETDASSADLMEKLKAQNMESPYDREVELFLNSDSLYHKRTAGLDKAKARAAGGDESVDVILPGFSKPNIPVVGGIFDAVTILNAAHATLLNAKRTNTNPVLTISIIGANMIQSAGSIWVLATSTFALAALIAGAITPANFAANFMIQTVTLFVAPIIGMMLALLAGLGAVMAFYVPLVPYIIL